TLRPRSGAGAGSAAGPPRTMNPPLLSISGLRFAHNGGSEVLAGVELGLSEGDVLVIVGPSGCGKTTLLRCIAGLEHPASGSITMDGRKLSDAQHFVAPEERGIGFVFQGLALFPHLTVSANVAFGLHGVPSRERSARVTRELKAVGLEQFASRYP